jgi:myo-inositol-1-phosphate synthase
LPRIGEYEATDLRFVAAFDVSANKVGKDLADAIHASPNETIRLAPVPNLGIDVLRGPTLDGIGRTTASVIEESKESPTDVVDAIRRAKADVVVNYLPVGSDNATHFYAAAALEAGCAFINCMPTSIASSPEWSGRFTAAGLPLIGDDVKSQLGATVLHRALLRLFRDRGVGLTNSYQLNVGGNADFLNMHEPERGHAKENSKIRAIGGFSSEALGGAPISASVGYIPGLGDRKSAYIRLDGLVFGAAPIALDVKLDVWDSPNSAGVVVDAIRYAKIALDNGSCGTLGAASAFLMKSPPEQMDEDDAIRQLQAISGLFNDGNI